MGSRVFVVTGANKGIGYYCAKLLCEGSVTTSDVVYLTSRDEERGRKAVEDLSTMNLIVKPRYHQLDIGDKESIEKLKEHLVLEHGGIDVLVNNAAIAYKQASTAPFDEQAEVTVRCNFFNTLDVCDSLFPLLRKGARVVNVSSMVSRMCFPKLSNDVQKKFSTASHMDDLKSLMSEFVDSAKDDTIKDKGFVKSAYGMSKVAVTFMTAIQQTDLGPNARGILVNCCCPGYCDTDMSSHNGPRAPDVGADVIIQLAMQSADASVGGKFWENRNEAQQRGSISVTKFY